MKSLISADQLIAEGQPVHEASLLQPEDTTEAAGRTQALRSDCQLPHCKSNQHTVSLLTPGVNTMELYMNSVENSNAGQVARAKPIGLPAREEDALHSCKGYKALSKAIRAAAHRSVFENMLQLLHCLPAVVEACTQCTSESTSLPTQLSLSQQGLYLLHGKGGTSLLGP